MSARSNDTTIEADATEVVRGRPKLTTRRRVEQEQDRTKPTLVEDLMSGKELGGASKKKKQRQTEKRWLVEKIENHRHLNGRKEFFVKWKGFDSDHNTWEDAERLEDDVPLIVQWYKRDIYLDGGCKECDRSSDGEE